MKTLKSIFILALVCITVIGSSWRYTYKVKTITIRALDEIVTPPLLKESANIISLRLTSYGLDTFSLNINADKGQIAVTVPDKSNMDDICRLLTQKGVITFCETWDRGEVFKLLHNDKLLDMFTPAGNRLGFIPAGDTSKVNFEIKSQKIPDKLMFRWGLVNEKSQVSLFALKTEGNPLLVRSDFEDMSYTSDGRINAVLKQENIKKWADASTINLNRSIAILIDDRVISDPVVRQRMESGSIEISGDFSEKEAGLIKAFLFHDPLPLAFSVVK
jgi:preprotein translocase subunit SecD